MLNSITENPKTPGEKKVHSKSEVDALTGEKKNSYIQDGKSTTTSQCAKAKIGEQYQRFTGRFFTSSSLHACSMILLGCPAVMPV
jgi:hypothetical protein